MYEVGVIFNHTCTFLSLRKTIFKAKQHMIHVNLSLALLLGLVVFVSGIETANDQKVYTYL